MFGVADPEPTFAWHQTHRHWAALFLHHSGLMKLNGVAYEYAPGTFFLVRPRSRVVLERAGGQGQEIFRFAFNPVDSLEERMAIPIRGDLTARRTHWRNECIAALGRLKDGNARMRSVLWQMLWSLAVPVESVRRSVYVDHAEKLIDERLAQPLSVSEIASELNVSHNHLTRLFRQEHGITPQEYIRQQRADAARKLLTQSTLPIKSVAAQIGVPDLQRFNKFIRETLGASPRLIRTDRGEMKFSEPAPDESEDSS
jgi:AraC-like DNA-binding protein